MQVYKTPRIVHRGCVLDLLCHFICRGGLGDGSLAHVGCPAGRVSVRSAREGGGGGGGGGGETADRSLVVSLLFAFLEVEPQVGTFSYR